MWRIRLGDRLRLRKPHACGENLWEVLRTGADIRIRCLRCRRMLLLPRAKLEARIREVLPCLPQPDKPPPAGDVL